MVTAPSPMPNSPEDCAACAVPWDSKSTSCVTTSESIASMKVTNLTDESMGLCVLCAITIPRIAIKKNPQLTQQTVKRLKEAFRKLYGTKPIEKISVRQITELAGYNHATFYLYFSSVRAEETAWPFLQPILFPGEPDIDSIADPAERNRRILLKQFYVSGIIGTFRAALNGSIMTDPTEIGHFVSEELLPRIAPHMQMPSQSETAQQPAASPQAQ